METAHVSFPAGYFAKQTQTEYLRPLEALMREFLQNSLDAGAKRVWFTAGDDWVMVRDDGRGITRARMVEALLTMGGTDKQAGAIGGFGNAKVALLFSHNAYRIRTLDTVVEGRVLSYHMRELNPGEAPVVGAEFTIWPAAEWSYSLDGFGRVLRDYLATCQLSVTVTFNGHVVPTGCTGRRIDIEFPHGRVLSRKLADGDMSYAAFVRVNGLTMFREGIRGTDRQVIIELEGNFREMFTSNRDGLRSPYSEALNQLTQQMAVDAKSFDRKKDETILFMGTLHRYFQQVEEATRVLALHMGLEEARAVVATVASAYHQAPDQLVAVETVLTAKGLGASLSAAEKAQVDAVLRTAVAKSHFATDFIVSIEGTDYRQPPVRYTPGRMLLRHERTAKLWRHCINLVLRANKESFNYRLGFVLDPDKMAYFKGNASTGAVLINPDKVIPGTDDKARFLTMLQTAAHELAHRRYTWHDEEFVLEEERLFRNALLVMRSVSEELRAAQKLTL